MHAPCPEEDAIVYKHILVGTDGSELAGRAVLHALGLAKALGAKVTAAAVTEPWAAAAPGYIGVAYPVEDYERSVSAHAFGILEGVDKAAVAEGQAVETVHVRDQFAAEGLIETAAARGCDLIVVASHGRRGLSRLVLGGEAYRLMCGTSVPVLIVR